MCRTMFIPYNANPIDNRGIDCTVRAICTVLDQDWVETYVGLVVQGLTMYDMPSSNKVWMAYLRSKGYKRTPIWTNFTCDYDCYTVRDFCYDHPYGKYLLSVDGHVIAVIDGNYYDTFDSGGEIVSYYFRKEDD